MVQSQSSCSATWAPQTHQAFTHTGPAHRSWAQDYGESTFKYSAPKAWTRMNQTQNFKQKSIATFQIRCFALAEKIWQSIHGRHPPTQSPLLPISSLLKHMLLINVPLFRRETKRFFNSLRCIGKQHFYNKSYCKRFLFGNLSLIDFKPGNKVMKC